MVSRRLVALVALLAVGGCLASAQPMAGAQAVAVPLRVIATTTLLASLAGDVGRGRADVSSLMPVGASPETYQPAPADIARLHQAGLIIENGAGLEAWLASTLANGGASSARVVVCSAGLPVIGANPHLWLDVTYARHYVTAMRDGMIAADPAGAATYRSNAAALDRRLVALDARIRAQIATLAPGARNMIVFHNAWLYYNNRYGLTTLGVIEENPGTEPSAAHFAHLVDLARAAHVRAIFAEPEYNPQLVNALARSAGIAHVAVLYDDSIGTAPGTRDYIEMLDTDTKTIVAALR